MMFFCFFYCCRALKYRAAGNFLIGCREGFENGRGFWRMCSWMLVRTCGNTVKSGSSSSAELDSLYPSIGELGLPSMTTVTTTTATAGSGRMCSTAAESSTRPPLYFSYDGDGHVRPPWVEVVDLTADSPNPSLPPLLLPLPPRLLLTPPGTVHFILRGTELYVKEMVNVVLEKRWLWRSSLHWKHFIFCVV